MGEHAPGEPCPGPVLGGWAVAARPQQTRTHSAEHRRDESQRRRDAEQRDQQSTQPDAAQEGQRHQDQGGQRDRHRHAAEQHASTGRGHGSMDAFVTLHPSGTFLPPPGDQQQRVVDGDAETDQRDEVLHHEDHVGHAREPEQREIGPQDGNSRHDQGHRGEQRAEDEDQYDESAQATQDDLDQDRTITAPAFGEQVEPGQLDITTGSTGLVGHRLDSWQGRGVRIRPRHRRWVEHHHGQGAVAGRQVRGTGVGRGDRPGAGNGLAHLGSELVSGGSGGIATCHEEERVDLPTAVEALVDQLVRLVGRLAGKGKLVGQPIDSPRRIDPARDSDSEPREDDQQPMPKHPVGETSHEGPSETGCWPRLRGA